MAGTSKLINMETKQAQEEKEAQKQVGKYIFDAPVFVITQGDITFSTAKIKNIEELAFFLNTHANMEMLKEEKGFDSNFLNQIKSDVNERFKKYEKDRSKILKVASNPNSRIIQNQISKIEERSNNFEKQIRFERSEKKEDERTDSGDTEVTEETAGSGIVPQLKEQQENVIEQRTDLANKFLSGTANWINANGGNYQAVLAARKHLEDKNLLGEPLDPSLSISQEWTKKDLVIASLLRSNSQGKLYLLEQDINGPEGYHAQITYGGDEAKAAQAYAAWKQERTGEKVNRETVAQIARDGVEKELGEEQKSPASETTETQQAEGKVEKEKQKEIKIKIQEVELKKFSAFIDKLELNTNANYHDAKKFSAFIDKLELNTNANYQDAALIFMADIISGGKKDKTEEFLEQLKNNPNAIKHADALAREYEANILINVAESTELTEEPVEIVPQVTGNIDWSNFSERNIDDILGMSKQEIISNGDNILGIDPEILKTLIKRDREENESRVIEILSENLPG